MNGITKLSFVEGRVRRGGGPVGASWGFGGSSPKKMWNLMLSGGHRMWTFPGFSRRLSWKGFSRPRVKIYEIAVYSRISRLQTNTAITTVLGGRHRAVPDGGRDIQGGLGQQQKLLNFCQNTGRDPEGVSHSRCERFDNFIFKMVQSGSFYVYLCILGQFAGEFRRIWTDHSLRVNSKIWQKPGQITGLRLHC